MLKLIKTSKYDDLISKVLFTSYFIYQFLFVFSVSALARNIVLIYSITTKLIMLSFAIIMFCAAYKLFRGFFTKVELIILTIIGFIMVVSFYHYRVVMVIANVFAITAFKNEDYVKIIKTYVYASCLAFLLNVLLGMVTPFTGNVTQTRNGVERIRYGLGFYYPTIGHFYFMSIVIAYLVYKKNISIIDYSVIFIINLILFILTDTKAPFAYIIIAIIMHVILVKMDFKIIDKLFGYFTIVSYPLFFISSYILYILYNPNVYIFQFLDRMLTGRLRLTSNALKEISIPLLGQTVSIWKDKEFYIDSSFVTMLVLNGLLVTIVCLLFSIFFCYISYKTKKKALLIALFLVAFRSMYDFGFMAMQLSPFTLLFYPVLDEYLAGRGRKF